MFSARISDEKIYDDGDGVYYTCVVMIVEFTVLEIVGPTTSLLGP